MVQENQELPYGADLGITFSIAQAIGRAGKMNISDLYKQVNAKNTPAKSYAKKMAEFVGLIRTNGTLIELTDAGKLFIANKNENDRKKFLANNLPPKYFVLLSWVKESKDGMMKINDLKQAVIRNKMEDKTNPNIYDWMLNNFANFAEYLGIIKYVKGQDSRCEITPEGIAVISHNSVVAEAKQQDTAPVIPTTQLESKPNQIFYADVTLDGEYPVRILTKDGKPFDWDIHTEEDWVLVEAALKAIKARWSKKYNVKE